MKSSRKTTLAARGKQTVQAVAGALALLCAAPSMAAQITFDGIPRLGYPVGDVLREDGFDVLITDGPYSGANGVIMTDDSCATPACPAGATGQYLGILNDGGVEFSLTEKIGPLGFRVAGFEFAFIAPTSGVSNGIYGRLQVNGVLSDSSTLSTSFDFPTQNAGGSFMFGQAGLDTSFREAIFTSLSINACMFNEDLVCGNSLDNPAYYTAQFALDNVELNVVPEPGSFLLLGLGGGALALGRRRFAKPAASTTLPAQGI